MFSGKRIRADHRVTPPRAARSRPDGAGLTSGACARDLTSGVCAREAAEQGKTVQSHLTHLVVHGVLHLLGRDHMIEAEAEAMEAEERVLLAGLGVSDPYEVIDDG